MNTAINNTRSWGEDLKAVQKLAAIQKSEGLLNRELSRS